MFEKFQPAKVDPILGLTKRFQADPRAEKIPPFVNNFAENMGFLREL